MVRRSFRGVWLRGQLPRGGFVWAANHHSWWDAFVACTVLWQQQREITVLVEPESLQRFRFLRSLGVLGTQELRSALDALRNGRVIVIFPEGELGPPGSLRPLQRGAGWLAEQTQVPLVAVAVRTTLRGHEAPEAYLDLQETSQSNLEATLTKQLALLDESLANNDPREPLPGFSRIIKGRRSWDERLGRQP